MNAPFTYARISNWDVSKVTNMDQMFLFSQFNQDISGWDVSRVTSFKNMFAQTPFNQNLCAWNTHVQSSALVGGMFVGSQCPVTTDPVLADLPAASFCEACAATVPVTPSPTPFPTDTPTKKPTNPPTDTPTKRPTDDEEVDVPNVPDVPDVGMNGDPHVKTWGGDWFDYMGECDLVLLHTTNLDGLGNDLDIHVRTTIRYEYSYIEVAAVQIGDEVLEVGSYGEFSLNGVEGADLPTMLAGYPVYHTQVNKKRHKFDIVLGRSENITISTFRDVVAVFINGGHQSAKYFGNSVGIMGSYNGTLLARDGVTVMENINEFGQEWQVTDEEPKLFSFAARHPQYPHKCILPEPKSEKARRLGETIAKSKAEEACSHLSGKPFDNCVFDVMAFGDLEMADAGLY